MIVITGGAGFIGSALAWRLNRMGRTDLLLVDRLGESEKWRNLVGLAFLDYLDKDDFITRLENGTLPEVPEAILHMGACSATTERDAGYLMENNYRYTARIARWWTAHSKCRFIYASSAATYGDGGNGYCDDEETLHTLRPLNMYGYSKHLFDLLAYREGWLTDIVGLKYFNVYGPNENHKDEMRSVINKAYPDVRTRGMMRLFKSHREDYADGEQKRDFLYVKDAVEMTLYFLNRSAPGGIYNVGTGTARSWNDVADSLFSAAGVPKKIEYVPMPIELRGKYQYYTCASLDKLKGAGCRHECMSLEDAIEEYVCVYLDRDEYLATASE